jgi:hypothetical protein
MAAKNKTKKKTKSSDRRKAAPKKKALKSKKRVARKSPKKALRKTPVAPPAEPVQPVAQENPLDIDEGQEQIYDAEDAIVGEKEEEELGEAV